MSCYRCGKPFLLVPEEDKKYCVPCGLVWVGGSCTWFKLEFVKGGGE